MVVLLDAGHGGCIAGHYQTSGKRSPIWEDGSVLYEGEFKEGVDYVDINPQDTDLSLSDRVSIANEYDDSIYVSIHANAGGGTGCEVFVSENSSSASVEIAESIQNQYGPHFYGERWRGIKRKDFYVIKNTKMPAILVECFFMDTEKDCKKYLMTRHGREQIAKWLFTSIMDYLKT
jgi:N-acetylmuramoyl-L-alanine amidase